MTGVGLAATTLDVWASTHNPLKVAAADAISLYGSYAVSAFSEAAVGLVIGEGAITLGAIAAAAVPIVVVTVGIGLVTYALVQAIKEAH